MSARCLSLEGTDAFYVFLFAPLHTLLNVGTSAGVKHKVRHVVALALFLLDRWLEFAVRCPFDCFHKWNHAASRHLLYNHGGDASLAVM